VGYPLLTTGGQDRRTLPPLPELNHVLRGMNRFPDRHGILDACYHLAARLDRRFAALLPPDRIPTSPAGNMLVVIEG
jgi:hypothetical protein